MEGKVAGAKCKKCQAEGNNVAGDLTETFLPSSSSSGA